MKTFAAAAKKHFDSDLTDRIVVTAGLGGMGGAQPLAIKNEQWNCNLYRSRSIQNQ